MVEVFGLQDASAGESAERARRWVSALLQRGSTIGSALGGLVAATDLQVTYQGAGLKIEIGAGEAFVGSNMISASQGAYYCRNTAAATFTLAAANSSNPRIERVSLVILDQAYEGSENLGEIKVSAGTASAGATLANLTGVAAAPKNSLTLAYCLVPAGATTITNAQIRNVAELVQLGIVSPMRGKGAATEPSLAEAEAGITPEPAGVLAAFVTVGVVGIIKKTLEFRYEPGTVGTYIKVTLAAPTGASEIPATSISFIVPPGKSWSLFPFANVASPLNVHTVLQ